MPLIPQVAPLQVCICRPAFDKDYPAARALHTRDLQVDDARRSIVARKATRTITQVAVSFSHRSELIENRQSRFGAIECIKMKARRATRN